MRGKKTELKKGKKKIRKNYSIIAELEKKNYQLDFQRVLRANVFIISKYIYNSIHKNF